MVLEWETLFSEDEGKVKEGVRVFIGLLSSNCALLTSSSSRVNVGLLWGEGGQGVGFMCGERQIKNWGRLRTSFHTVDPHAF